MLIRSVGGRSGPLALENGAELTFPWAALQRVAGTAPGSIYAQSTSSGGTFNTLTLEAPASLPGALRPAIELRSEDDGTPSIFLSVNGVSSGYLFLNEGLSMGGLDIQFNADDTLRLFGSGTGAADGVIIWANGVGAGTVDIQALGTGPISLTTASGNIYLASGGLVQVTAETSMVVANDATTGTDITIQSNRDLFLFADSDVDILATTGNIIMNSLPITGAWNTSFSPVVKQNNVTVASTVAFSHYWKIGRTVVFVWWSAITGTGTAAQAITVTVPFPCAGTTVAAGIWSQYDASLNQHLVGAARLYSTTEVSAVLHGANNWIGISGYAEALVNTDAILGMVIYEATS